MPSTPAPDGAPAGATAGETPTLHRCRVPTDWLCPCGRVARELRRHGVAYAERRAPQRRARRAEVRELSGQDRLPLLVLDGEPICDSHRIVEHLRWRAGRRQAAQRA